MPSEPKRGRYLNAMWVVFLLAAFLFLSPVVLAWTAPGAPWYLPYILWLGIIVLTLVVDRLRDRHDL